MCGHVLSRDVIYIEQWIYPRGIGGGRGGRGGGGTYINNTRIHLYGEFGVYNVHRTYVHSMYIERYQFTTLYTLFITGHEYSLSLAWRIQHFRQYKPL